jgi:serine/threonine protein kinase
MRGDDSVRAIVGEEGGVIRPGTTIGPYQVQEVLGRGGMGIVYLGYHAALDRLVAVKVMNSLVWDAASAARFQREARTIARLRHPNIVSVFDFGERNGVPWMVVEYMPGGNLGEALAAGETFSGSETVMLLRGVASALDYAHGAGVVHRDVKPSNVLISRDGAPVIADFGLSKLMQEASLTASGLVSGTPTFMAPEQATGAAAGPAADQYALAVMAYRLLAGRYPFSGSSPVELLYQHVHQTPQAPSTLDGRLSPEVDAALARALAKQPGERWPGCVAFVDGLGVALGVQPTSGSAPASPTNEPEPTAATLMVSSPQPAAVAAPTVPAAGHLVDSGLERDAALLIATFMGLLTVILFGARLLTGA